MISILSGAKAGREPLACSSPVSMQTWLLFDLVVMVGKAELVVGMAWIPAYQKMDQHLLDLTPSLRFSTYLQLLAALFSSSLKEKDSGEVKRVEHEVPVLRGSKVIQTVIHVSLFLLWNCGIVETNLSFSFNHLSFVFAIVSFLFSAMAFFVVLLLIRVFHV
jgi:hypothetical protein